MTAAREATEAAEHELRKTVELTALVATVESFAARLTTGLADTEWADRQKIVRALVREVVVDGENVRIVYQIPGVSSREGGGSKGRSGPASAGSVPGGTPKAWLCCRSHPPPEVTRSIVSPRKCESRRLPNQGAPTIPLQR